MSEFRALIAAGLLTLCSGASASPAAAPVPEQTPEVGTNQEVWGAIDIVWKIRRTRKWGESLSDQERRAATLALEAFDDFIMNKGVAFFTPQFFARMFDQKVVGATRIRVIASDQLFARFEPGAGSIDISMGLVAAFYWTQLAVEEARENPALAPHLAEYLFALSRNNFQRTPISASSVIRLTEFVTGSPWVPGMERTNTVDTRVFEAVRDGLIFVVAHEGCHAALGHRPTAEAVIAVRQEREADECATIRAGPPGMLEQFNPYLPLAVLALAGLNDQRQPRPLTTHPNALCRIGWMLYNGGNTAKSINISLPLFPMLADVYQFRPLAPEVKARLTGGYDHPNFVAVHRIVESCGGWQVLNPRAFTGPRAGGATR